MTIQLVAWVFAFLVLTLVMLLIGSLGSACLLYTQQPNLYLIFVPLSFLAFLCLCIKSVFRTLLSIDLNFVKGMCFAELMMHISILLGIVGFFIGLGSAR